MIIRTGEHVWQLRMHHYISNEVCVIINDLELLTGVVIEDPHLRVISTDNDPLLARNEFRASDWGIRHLEGSDLGLLVVVVDCHVPCVERDQHPRQSWMQLNTLHTLGSTQQLLFDF